MKSGELLGGSEWFPGDTYFPSETYFPEDTYAPGEPSALASGVLDELGQQGVDAAIVYVKAADTGGTNPFSLLMEQQ